ncbi:MAG TPA: histidine ammonia-lyase [Myxococcota bacterium]|nr:histidine ammonia-lyase [Myxococcota bacterium]
MIALGDSELSPKKIEEIVFASVGVEICEIARERAAKGYQLLKNASFSHEPIYGINTGFGALAEIRIDQADQERLQQNIILSHAVGLGDPLDFYTAKTLMLLRLNTLIQGYSGASLALIGQLERLINANCAPYIPKKGSVGASGDLAPLAHLGLLCLGLGPAFVDQQLTSADLALRHAQVEPLRLGLRDGLALINGTQAMAAIAAISLRNCVYLSHLADLIASMTLQALGGHVAPYDARIHALKPHPGQINTADHMRRFLEGFEDEASIKSQLTQDPYSLRCIPQVHGATKDVISHVQELVFREINSVTDNPLIFFAEDFSDFAILSGGNFHGQHLSLALDYLAMAMAELASIAERRIELLVNAKHSNGLPPFLIEGSGLNSGYMILHVTAAALVGENKILCHPASVDSIPTSASREDHVSMGMNAANKLVDVITNTTSVLAIELMASCQALDLREKKYVSESASRVHKLVREVVPYRKQDGLFHNDLMQTISLLKTEKMKQFTLCEFPCV